MGDPPLGGTVGAPAGAAVSVCRLVVAEPLVVAEAEPTVTLDELTLASTCVPAEPEVRLVPVVATGVEAEVEADT